MIDVIFLAFALAMDAFAVSIGLGAGQAGVNHDSQNPTHTQNKEPKTQEGRPVSGLLKLALIAGLYFGAAQGVMPLIGYLLGSAILGQLALAAPWIGFVILLVLGVKMVLEGLKDKKTSSVDINNTGSVQVNHKMMASLAIATSIDALAAGFTLNLLAVSAVIACFIIAIITAFFSFIGVYLGDQSGTWLEPKAEILGGVVLIVIGVNMVV